MNKIAIFEGYSMSGFAGAKRKRKSSGRKGGVGAWQRKFGACGRKCAKGKKPGTKSVGTCMRTCLKKRG